MQDPQGQRAHLVTSDEVLEETPMSVARWLRNRMEVDLRTHLDGEAQPVVRNSPVVFKSTPDLRPRPMKRDKSKNTPAFNKMAKARRATAKKNAAAKKKNRR